MKIFQSAYDWFKNIKTPLWYKQLMSELQKVILSILIQVGKDYITQIQNKILDVSLMDIPNKEKFRLVFTYGKELLPDIKDSALNMLIEVIFSRLKGDRVV